jgi:hypothetical protein
MKTGKLLKFQRPGAAIHAYLYKEGASFMASLYVMDPRKPARDAAHTVRGETEAGVERDVRAWVEKNYPKG